MVYVSPYLKQFVYVFFQNVWKSVANTGSTRLYKFSPLVQAQSLRLTPERDYPGCYDVTLHGARTSGNHV